MERKESGNVFHVIGGGRFGRQAIRRLLSLPGARLVVVERDESAAARLAADFPQLGDFLVVGDGIAHIVSLLGQSSCAAEWIIPTLPVHLAATVLERFTGCRRLDWEEPPPLPNSFCGNNGELYSSLADFRCPEDCPQPEDHCFTTGEPREKSLVELLAGIAYHGYPSLVLQSRQLAPGVGGFTFTDLSTVAEKTAALGPGPVVFSTACLCHGVSNILALPARVQDCHGA
ncbi:MAG: NAD-binding protein [Deltaproteobacteria bacterium]|nr:NAD-binding protein [Candidatus Anaeroferrophillus wilburensis]MBN2888169.1 NAD-binding protein [Deltaproteobacteria bacterium]